MKHLKGYLQYIRESISKDAMVLEPGHVLFHSTIEDFEADEIRGGGYDGVVWTAEDSAISQTYIPVSSGLGISTSTIVKPSKDKDIQNLQAQLGILYDYSKVKFDDYGRVSSYPAPSVFAKFNDDHYAALKQMMAAEDAYKKCYDYYISDERDTADDESAFQELLATEKAKDDAKKAYFATNAEKLKNQYVNDKLESVLGYKPRTVDTITCDNSWYLKSELGNVVPADYRAKGRLLIFTAKEPIRIFDYAGNREGDLMDVDYHKVGLFRKAEEAGYDGIRITDFAQIEEHGNVGHISFGIFPGSVKKFSIEVVDGVTHPTPDQLHTRHEQENNHTTKWHSPEYLAHLKKKNA